MVHDDMCKHCHALAARLVDVERDRRDLQLLADKMATAIADALSAEPGLTH